MDTRSGFSTSFVKFENVIRRKQSVKRKSQSAPIVADTYLLSVAGNVVTGEMTEQLILTGADIVKVA